MLDNLGDWKRSDACADLRQDDDNREVLLMGWVHRRRDHGGLVFLNLRDRSGICQVVIDSEDACILEKVKHIRSEFVLAVKGRVRLRPDGMRNAEMPSGDVEVLVEELRILNASKTPPFPIESVVQDEVSDEIRFKYRYLDLRRHEMQERMIFRHDIVRAIRDFLSSEGFLEIETPLLIRSTPEGARDYVVPSRLQQGCFYALPQSPQLYKQLLMVAGYEKYFQMARCMRDEDLRGDRQPEHTQIDMEMSFVSEEEIFAVVESLLQHIFKTVMGQDLPGSFLCLSYAEAMDRFGTDKPDMRFGLELVDLSEIAAASTFNAFKSVVESGGRVKGIRVPGAATFSRKQITELEDLAKHFKAKGLAWMKVTEEGLSGGVSKFFADAPGEAIAQAMELEVGDLLLMVADTPQVAAVSLGAVRSRLGAQLKLTEPGDFRFLWVHRFPLFEWNEDHQRWDAMHHLFSMPCLEDIDKLESDPGQVHGQLYDLVCNGVELASGSIRIHRRDIQERVMAVVGIDKAEAEERFGFLLGAFDFGAPPHGGIAPGLDRLLMVLDGGSSIRDYIAFPKTLKGTSPMVGSPSPIDDEQLKELGLEIRGE
ncbi:MAG: aspartate--tRNA ligase [bacterium]|nr:aspartate--tRNA ligase [bacterium]